MQRTSPFFGAGGGGATLISSDLLMRKIRGVHRHTSLFNSIISTFGLMDIRVMLWCLKFPPISSTQSIFLPQRVIWSFRVCGSSLTRTPPRPDPRPGPSDDAHASRETRGDALRRRLLRRGFERRQSLTPQCSVAYTALISRSLLLP
jgi:hypothetical protein